MTRKNDNRLYICPEVRYLLSDIHLTKPRSKQEDDVTEIFIDGSKDSYFIAPINYELSEYDRFWDFPILYEKDCLNIWEDGTLFLKHIVSSHEGGPFDVNAFQNKAARLLEYKKFVESEGADYLDFSQRRPQARITYRYFAHLYYKNISASVLNQKTSIVYQFYIWLSQQDNVDIDLSRVDQTRDVWIKFKNKSDKASGSRGKKVKQRSQTLRVPKSSDTKKGFIREDGEELRPLSDKELSLMMQSLGSNLFNTQERLVCQFAVNTGARKQTTLTLRRSTFEKFNVDQLEPDKTLKIAIGRGSNVDSKFSKPSFLYIPLTMVEMIISYIDSDEYKDRLKKYRSEYPKMREGDEYVFLSREGQPRYMSVRDPYFRQLGHKKKGKLAKDIVAKLKADESINDFPRDFTFHWTRATFARNYYEHLLPQVNEGNLTVTDALHLVAKRLAHSDIAVTQMYIDIFNKYDYLLDAQNRYEERVYQGIYL